MNDYATVPEAQLGVFRLALVPRAEARFRATPARSLHAALLRRLELLSPDLSQALHNAVEGARALDRPWTISTLLGPLRREGGEQVALPGTVYQARITVLVPKLLTALADAFDPATSLGREPLYLERVPFCPLPESCRLESLATYASLLTRARPVGRIALAFRSPTGFHSQRRQGLAPPLQLCLEGYLRKWNTFAEVLMPERELLEYVAGHAVVKEVGLRPATMPLGQYYEKGVVGEIVWEAGGESPEMLRLVNALVDYARYCGTGVKTAQGMGQTVRLR